MRFDPLIGCDDAATAMDRASDLIDGIGRSKPTTPGTRWDGFAKQTLRRCCTLPRWAATR